MNYTQQQRELQGQLSTLYEVWGKWIDRQFPERSGQSEKFRYTLTHYPKHFSLFVTIYDRATDKIVKELIIKCETESGAAEVRTFIKEQIS